MPKWVHNPGYPGAEVDIYNYFLSVKFWSIWDGRDAQLGEQEVLERALAEVEQSVIQDMLNLENAAERAALWAMHRFKKNRRQAVMEYDDLREAIYAAVDDSTGKEKYHIDSLIFWADTVLDTLAEQGVPVAEVVGAQDSMQKLRESTPRLKELLDKGDVAGFKTLAKKVAQSSLHDAREAIYHLAPEEDEKLTMRVYFRPEGSRVVLFEVKTEEQMGFIRRSMKKIIAGEESSTVDQLLREITGEILGKETVWNWNDPPRP